MSFELEFRTVKLSPWLHILIDRFKARLSGLKANLLSISGRLTLIKFVLGSIDLGGCQTSRTWANIVETINHLHSSGVVSLNSIRFKVEVGSSIRFWKNTWLGNDPLYIIYNRLFHLENNKDCFISQRILNGSWEWDWCRPITMGRSKTEFDNLIINNSNMEIDDLVESDTCVWSLSNDDSFSVNSVRKHIDEHSSPSLFSCARWYKMIPKKNLVRSWIDLPLPSFLSCEDWTNWFGSWHVFKDKKS
nr:RNA-directed DNA polymerase, eukaryota [Tanacetum cinerariifolium]